MHAVAKEDDIVALLVSIHDTVLMPTGYADVAEVASPVWVNLPAVSKMAKSHELMARYARGALSIILQHLPRLSS